MQYSLQQFNPKKQTMKGTIVDGEGDFLDIFVTLTVQQEYLNRLN